MQLGLKTTALIYLPTIAFACPIPYPSRNVSMHTFPHTHYRPYTHAHTHTHHTYQTHITHAHISHTNTQHMCTHNTYKHTPSHINHHTAHTYHRKVHTPQANTYHPTAHLQTHTTCIGAPSRSTHAHTRSSSRQPADPTRISISSLLIPQIHVFSHFYHFFGVEFEGKSHQPELQGHLDRNLKFSGSMYLFYNVDVFGI